MKRKIGFAVAGVMATFGALLVFLYLKDNRNTSTAAPPAPADTAAVDDFSAIDPPDDQSADAADAADPAAVDPISAEKGSLTQITFDNRIIELGDPVVVPPDYLQVSFTTTADRALGGRVRPGDTVAIIVSFNETVEDDEGAEQQTQTTDVLLHKALVADVQVEDVLGGTSSSAGMTVEVPEGALNGTNSQLYTISIAVPSTQVERLVYAVEHGSVWLAYQPPEAGETTNGIVTIENIHEEVSIFIDREDLTALTGDEGQDAPADLAFDLGDETAPVEEDPEG